MAHVAHHSKARVFPYVSFRRTFPFSKTGVVLESLRYTCSSPLPTIVWEVKEFFFCIDVPCRTRVYHPFSHIGHKMYFRNDLNNYIFSFDYICQRRIVVPNFIFVKNGVESIVIKFFLVPFWSFSR